MAWTLTEGVMRSKKGETIRLGVNNSIKWAEVDIDGWYCAVIVFGNDQREATRRARMIVSGVTLLQARREQAKRRRAKR